MKISCQTCGQILPKTAVMCPNCGGRTFLPVSDNAVSQGQFAQTTPSTPTTQWTMPQTAQPQSVAQPVTQPPLQQPSLQPQPPQQSMYVPPVAPPIAPQYSQPVYTQQTSQDGYQNNYSDNHVSPSPSLPPSVYHSRKLASQMVYAGMFKRGFAFVFDVVLIGLLLGLAYQLAVPEIVKQLKINGINDQTLIVSAVTIYLLYMSIFTSSGRQGTIGKMMMGLWVFGMQGQRINFFHALFRELLKVVLLPLFFIMWFTARKQTMADLLARTVVLYDPS